MTRFLRLQRDMKNDRTFLDNPLEEHLEKHFEGLDIGSWSDLPEEDRADIEAYLQLLNDDIVELQNLDKEKEPE